MLTEDDPYLGPGAPYRMMRLVRGNRSAKRCRLRPAQGPGHNPKWAYIFDLIDDFERHGSRTAQSITMVTNVGTFQIEGFGLDVPGGLYEMLEQEHVLEVAAYDVRRHGTKPSGPYVSAIREVLEAQGKPEPQEEPDEGERHEGARAA